MKLLLGLLLAACSTDVALAQDKRISPVQDAGNDFILTFSESPTDQISLLDLVKICQEATGRQFTHDQQTGTQLAATKVVMFGQKRIPKSEFYNFFQIQ